MTRIAPDKISTDGKASEKPGRPTIRRLISWLPTVTWSFGSSPAVERGDTVVSAEWMTPADGVIGLRLCKADGREYGVELSLPAAAAEKALQAIRPGMTLAAVGELEIGPAAEEPETPPLAPG